MKEVRKRTKPSIVGSEKNGNRFHGNMAIAMPRHAPFP